MIKIRSFMISILLSMLCVPFIYAQDLSSYRGFQLGMNLVEVARLADMKPSEARVIYQRPAVIQELEWLPRNFYSSTSPPDPVREVLFSFYNSELYRIVVNYDSDRTEGLTDQDLIEAISAQYGTSTTPVATIVSSSPSKGYSESEKVIARWENPQYSFNLFRFSYRSAPGMLGLSKRLDALAQLAIVQAIRLNELEAPQREIDRKKREDDEKRAAEQEARPTNKENFRP